MAHRFNDLSNRAAEGCVCGRQEGAMPFAQIDMIEGRTEAQKRAVIEKVTAALVEAAGTSAKDLGC